MIRQKLYTMVRVEVRMIKATSMESEVRNPGRMKGDEDPIGRLKKTKKKKTTV